MLNRFSIKTEFALFEYFMFEFDSADQDNPESQRGLQDITERMSLLLTSYEGPSDRLSQRLALKREKEHNEMKGVILGVLADFNQVVDEREVLLASVKKWFDVSCKLLSGVDVLYLLFTAMLCCCL